MLTDLKHQDIIERVSLRASRPDSPTVERIRTNSGDYLLKSYEHCSVWLRQTVGRLAISREVWALKALADSPHSPALVSRPSPWTVVTEFVEGIPLERSPQLDSSKLLNEARSLLNDLEKAGVVHGDLGHDHWQSMGRECNLIWTESQRLVAIDFAGSLPTTSNFFPLKKLFEALRHHDRLLTAKLSHHFPVVLDRPLETPDWPLGRWDLLRLLGKL